MFLTLLVITFLISLLASFVVVRIFDRPITSILTRIVVDDIRFAWIKYIKFAIYVVGISGGVRIWDLEKYITGRGDDAPLVLTTDRWALEVYRTVISTLQSVAWMLLVFFVFALIAYVIVRAFELKRGEKNTGGAGGAPAGEV